MKHINKTTFFTSLQQLTLFVVVMLGFFSQELLAQSPDAFKYQTVIRDAAGQPLANQAVSLRIRMLEGSPMGVARYIETHKDTTNAFGLVSLNIGQGTVFAGSWASVDWAGHEQFVQIELDDKGGSSYRPMGTSQLLSVPYALHANTANEADNAQTAVAVTGPINELDPVYSASLAAAITSSDTSYWNSKLNTEADPVFAASVAGGITAADVSNWNGKLDTESDPVFAASVAGGITAADVSNWNNKLDTEVDGDVTNEIQSLRVSLSNDTLFLSQSNWVIIPGLTLANPRCDDGIQNGDEVGVDCGGSQCAPCAVNFLLGEGYNPCEIIGMGIPVDSLYGIDYEGGMIFYVDTANCFGLVASYADLDSAIWGGSWFVNNSDNAGVRLGQTNTTAIVANSGTLATAAKACDDLVLNGKSDWFLPSIDATTHMFNNLVLNGFGTWTPAPYWSSTQASFTNAWSFNPTNGPTSASKASLFRVRAVRSFSF